MSVSRSLLINICIGLLWLFHISAIIGIYLGYEQWFISKTPMNLSLVFGITLVGFRIDSIKKLLWVLVPLVGGMLIEMIGVNTGWPFGTYSYGANLGYKIMGVPWTIGLNWAVLVLICSDMTQALDAPWYVRYAFAALMMVFLDVVIEGVAPTFDFWEFELSPVPVQNYVAWFVVAFLIQVVLGERLKGNQKLSSHIWVVQFVFFGFFYLLYA